MSTWPGCWRRTTRRWEPHWRPARPPACRRALEHSRPGGLIVADNVVRAGALADAASDDPKVAAQRRLHELLSAEDRVSATTIQTVGAKGYDGFTVALVK